MATPISPREKAWRTAELTSWLEMVRLMLDRDRSFEDAIILWAVRKCEYEDKPATLAAIEALTGLSHSTVSQNCKRMRKDGRLVAEKARTANAVSRSCTRTMRKARSSSGSTRKCARSGTSWRKPLPPPTS